MHQLWQGINNTKLSRGVCEGLLVRPTSGLGNAGLTVTVDPGYAITGTLEDDAGVAVAYRGHNQPGKVVERLAAVTNQAIPDATARLLWLKTDGTLALSLVPTSDQTLADVAPEAAPNPDRGAFGALTQNALRVPLFASVLLAKITTAGGAITACDNSVREIAVAI